MLRNFPRPAKTCKYADNYVEIADLFLSKQYVIILHFVITLELLASGNRWTERKVSFSHFQHIIGEA